MNNEYIFSKINNDIIDIHKTVCDNVVKECQKKYDKKNFTSKNATDKIPCIICGGKYTRSRKSKHEKATRHVKCMELLYSYTHEKIIEN